MAYEGYLIKIGYNSSFFNKYIVFDTYKVSKKIIDLDSYRDANGVLHRQALEHVSYTVEFELRPLMEAAHAEIMEAIENSFTIPEERKLSVTFWLPETHEYVTADCYMPDPEITVKAEYGGTNLRYDKTTLKFIGY